MASFVFFDISHKIGGAEVSLMELCPRLESDTAVVCAQGSSFESELQKKGVSTCPIPIEILRDGGFFAKINNYAAAKKTRKELGKILENTGGDIFISNNLMADFCAGSVPARFFKAAVCYVRDDPCRKVTAKYLKTRDLAVAPSRMIQESLSSIGVTGNVMIHNGIDIDYFKDGPDKSEARKLLDLPEESVVVGAAGQFIKRKGWDSFIACAERLAGEVKNLICIIAGEDLYKGSPYAKKLKDRISSTDNIQFMGFQEDMRPFYSACDIYLTLSRNEPFGRTPLEAALCGTLPVVSNEGGYKETLGDIPDLLVSPDNIDSICSTLKGLLNNKEERNTLLEKSCSQAETFSADKTAQAFEKACLNLI
ncbi:glycosyltransferase family 4 protein [Planctomycetota bacterium]